MNFHLRKEDRKKLSIYIVISDNNVITRQKTHLSSFFHSKLYTSPIYISFTQYDFFSVRDFQLSELGTTARHALAFRCNKISVSKILVKIVLKMRNWK